MRTSVVVLVAALLYLPSIGHAQDESQHTNLLSEIQVAINQHPEVQAAWHAFQVSIKDVDIARSGYRPSVDLTLRSTYEDRNYGLDQEYTRNLGEVTLTQMLWDGWLTRSEVARFKQAQMVRYFELLDAIENIALETSIAYLDVLLYRDLVRLAEENLRTHVDVFRQIEQSVSAGVSRGADLEQINGRLSLSESNLITEISNLHDVSARYLRLTGHMPYAQLNEPQLSEIVIPESVNDALMMAYVTNPGFNAALYNIDSQKLNVKSQRSNYQPRLDLIAGYTAQNRDEQGLGNGINEASVGLQFSFNLYNGGADKARVRQAITQVNLARDLRDKACVDMRQTLQIAFNDITKLNDQIPVLNEHRLSSDRVKTAYMDQFDIGQRTLLDVLDSENEFFQSSRAYIEATYTQKKAILRTLATMGQLLKSLGIARANLPTPEQITDKLVSYDPAHVCPSYDLAPDVMAQVTSYQDDDKDGVTNLWDLCADTPSEDKVDMDGCSVFSEDSVTLNINIPFATDSSTIENAYVGEVQKVAEFLNRFPETQVVINGHASLDGDAGYNKRLSEQRAFAVADMLVTRFGIEGSRVSSVGWGEERPLTDEESPEANAQNRRIEAEVTASTKQVVPRF